LPQSHQYSAIVFHLWRTSHEFRCLGIDIRQPKQQLQLEFRPVGRSSRHSGATWRTDWPEAFLTREGPS
jgi:hypothetical protein